MIHKEFYTNCQILRDQIAYRGVSATGKRIKQLVPYKPSLFVPALSKTKTEYKTIFGQPLERMEFEGIYAAQKFMEKYKDVENFQISGNTNYHYCYLMDRFHGEIEYDRSLINIAILDIEVCSDNGFPNVDLANEPIISISIKIGNDFFVFGLGEFYSDDTSIHYQSFDDEEEMLKAFIQFWKKSEIDIVTGWNVNLFDIPYIVQRCTNIFGSSAINDFSPWGSFYERTITVMGKVHRLFSLKGLSILDYLDLYKKYSPRASQESYRLDYIAQVELGERKLNYEEYGNLRNLHKENYQKFIEYNIQDVRLVDKLEEKMKLIDLVIVLAYDAKVNYDDVLSQVRVWDNLIFGELHPKKIVVPCRKITQKGESYPGAFVKEPLIGMHKWVGCFDVASLYPNLIRMFNISPETLVREESEAVSVDGFLNRKYDLDFLKANNMTLAANGCLFRKQIVGFLPKLMTRLYEERKIYKKKMIDSMKELERVKKEIKRRKEVETR